MQNEKGGSGEDLMCILLHYFLTEATKFTVKLKAILLCLMEFPNQRRVIFTKMLFVSLDQQVNSFLETKIFQNIKLWEFIKSPTVRHLVLAQYYPFLKITFIFKTNLKLKEKS